MSLIQELEGEERNRSDGLIRSGASSSRVQGGSELIVSSVEMSACHHRTAPAGQTGF